MYNLNYEMMKLKKINGNIQLVLALVIMLVIASCGGKESEVGSASLISGADNKTWKADKELNAAGEKEALSEQEEAETMQFYADGRFALGGSGTLQTGTWAFDEAAKRLTLNFENQEAAETFDVATLTEDKMVLKAPDGSEMRLEAE